MSLRDDLSVFREPGFYVSAALAIVLILGVLLIAGFIHSYPI